MRFRAFEKIPATGHRSERKSPGGRWVALEKIHGAQLVLGCDGERVCFGKRKAWLDEDEPFFGWQVLRAELRAAALALAQRWPGAQVTVYGELHGGAYPHPAVAALPGLSAVQTGVWYGPDLAYAAFDVLVAQGDEDEGELLTHSEVEALAAAVGLRAPPVLRRGSYAEVAETPLRFTTRVPLQRGLPALPENWAEGLVLKPDPESRSGSAVIDRRTSPRERAVFKRKIPEFHEGGYDESQPFGGAAAHPGAPRQALDLEALLCWSERLVNPPRLASARSKVGPQVVPLLDEVVLDVLIDLSAAFPAALVALAPAQEERLAAQIRARAAALLATP